MIDNSQEYIVCSAIWFDDGVARAHLPRNIDTGLVACALRHCNCFTILRVAFPDREYLDGENSIQGFLTSKGEFVTRQIAASIAICSGQIDKPSYWHNELDSSDIFK